jgi:hypothetical protein
VFDLCGRTVREMRFMVLLVVFLIVVLRRIMVLEVLSWLLDLG